MKTLGILFLTGLWTVFLTGCVSVLPEEPAPSRKIVLVPHLSQKIEGNNIAGTLIVEKPLMLESLDSTRIKIILQDNAGVALSDFIAGIEWSDRLPNLLQEALITLSEKTEKFAAVGKGEENFKAAYRLQVTITNFEVIKDTGQPMRVFVGFSAKLIHPVQRKVITQKTFSQEIFLKKDSLKEIVKAFENVLSLSFTDLIIWSLKVHKGD